MTSIQRVSQLDENNIIQWPRRRYRRNPVGGLIENKILNYALLESLGIPIPQVYYGVFARKNVGKWPQYNRHDFIEAMRQIPQVSQQHHFVVKPATHESAEGTLIMNELKWKRQGWTLERLADHVEGFLNVTQSRSGQQYEHVGALILQSILSERANPEFDHGSFIHSTGEDQVPVFELKAHVVFGELCGARINPVPINPNVLIDFSFCNKNKHGDPYLRFMSEENGASQHFWDIARPIIKKQMHNITTVARQIYEAYGVDFYRLDVFMDANGLFVVNENTYPSFVYAFFDCTYQRLFDAYQDGNFDMVNGTSVTTSLLERIGVDYDYFVSSTDYPFLNPKTEEEYDAEDFVYISDLEPEDFEDEDFEDEDSYEYEEEEEEDEDDDEYKYVYEEDDEEDVEYEKDYYKYYEKILKSRAAKKNGALHTY